MLSVIARKGQKGECHEKHRENRKSDWREGRNPAGSEPGDVTLAGSPSGLDREYQRRAVCLRYQSFEQHRLGDRHRHQHRDRHRAGGNSTP